MAISDEISRLQSAKADIKTAIEGKGVTVPSSTLLDGYAALISSIPAGSGNIVSGSFTANSSSGVQTVTLPYTGSGYPIAALVCLSDGLSSATNPTWASTVQRYTVGCWSAYKNAPSTAPTYATSGTQNAATTQCTYKNNTSGTASYLRGGDIGANTFSSSNAGASGNTCVRFKSKTTMSVFVAGTSYGLAPGFNYTYFVIYSS